MSSSAAAAAASNLRRAGGVGVRSRTRARGRALTRRELLDGRDEHCSTNSSTSRLALLALKRPLHVELAHSTCHFSFSTLFFILVLLEAFCLRAADARRGGRDGRGRALLAALLAALPAQPGA